MQKSATPVPTPASVEQVCALLESNTFNAAVNQNSCQDEVDRITQQNAVLQNWMDKLKKEVNTGNAMIDQFALWYIGVAFAFYFHV